MNTERFKQASWIGFAATLGRWLLPLAESFFVDVVWLPSVRAAVIAVVYCLSFILYIRIDKRFWICIVLYGISTYVSIALAMTNIEELESLVEIAGSVLYFTFAISLCFFLKDNANGKAKRSAENTMWAYGLGLVFFLCGILFRTTFFAAIGAVVLFICEFLLVRVFYRCAKQ